MRVLLDNGTPRGLAAALEKHVVEECRSRGWDSFRNGELLDASEAAGFDVLVTTDRNMRHQQNFDWAQDRGCYPDQRTMDAHSRPPRSGCRGREFGHTGYLL